MSVVAEEVERSKMSVPFRELSDAPALHEAYQRMLALAKAQEAARVAAQAHAYELELALAETKQQLELAMTVAKQNIDGLEQQLEKSKAELAAVCQQSLDQQVAIEAHKAHEHRLASALQLHRSKETNLCRDTSFVMQGFRDGVLAKPCWADICLLYVEEIRLLRLHAANTAVAKEKDLLKKAHARIDELTDPMWIHEAPFGWWAKIAGRNTLVSQRPHGDFEEPPIPLFKRPDFCKEPVAWLIHGHVQEGEQPSVTLDKRYAEFCAIHGQLVDVLVQSGVRRE